MFKHVGKWLSRVFTFKGNVRTLSITSLVGGTSLILLRVTLQPFVLSLGVSMAYVGLLETFGGRGGVVNSIIQPFAGWLSDRKGRKLFIILGSVLSLAALTFSTLASYFQLWIWLIPTIIALGLSGISLPAADSTAAESVEVGERSMAFTVIMFFSLLPGIFASVVGGLMADQFGFTTVFLLGAILQAFNIILVWFFVRETLRTQSAIKLSQLTESLKSLLIPIKNLRGFYLAISSDSFFWGIGAAILSGLVRKTYNFSNFQLGMMSSIFFISSAATQLPMGILVKKYGCKKLLMLSEVVGITMMIGWLMFTSFEAFAFFQILMGLVVTTWVPAIKTFLANSVSEEERAEALGKLAAFRGLVAFPAPYLGGILYDALGFAAPIMAGLVGVVFTLVLIFLLVHDP